MENNYSDLSKSVSLAYKTETSGTGANWEHYRSLKASAHILVGLFPQTNPDTLCIDSQGGANIECKYNRRKWLILKEFSCASVPKQKWTTILKKCWLPKLMLQLLQKRQRTEKDEDVKLCKERAGDR